MDVSRGRMIRSKVDGPYCYWPPVFRLSCHTTVRPFDDGTALTSSLIVLPAAVRSAARGVDRATR